VANYKLNFQNIPARRKDVKKVFKAREGYTIINADLATAEVWIAAALSGDTFLQNAFISGLDFHSFIAKTVFSLECSVDDIKEKYSTERQSAKTITFAILYGASVYRVFMEFKSFGLDISMDKTQAIIDDYFANAKGLKVWLDSNNLTLRRTGKLLYAQGRVRTISDVFNVNSKVVDHAVRSGLNSLFQGPASDVMLMGCSDFFKDYCNPKGWITNDLVKPFTIVHDSLTSEVHNSVVDEYKAGLKESIQRHRYFLPKDFHETCPIGVDFEQGPNWGEVV